MVGVPGKSTGCTTCRRRKIKCDETKPTCLKCAKASIKCEGYDRFPVFINRTQSGLTRRTRFEEAKSSSVTSIPTLTSPHVEAAGLIPWFWNSFARSPPSRYALQSPGHWVDCFLTQYHDSLALQSSLLAVATVRLSKAVDRPDVLTEGRRLYAQSLNLTREAICSKSGAMQDAILATTCVMVLYELFDSTTKNLHGWLHHLAGLARLIEWRGPKMHAHPAAHAIFEHTRYLLMLRHLLARKSSVLSQRAWLEEPWRGQKKSIEQQVFDEGLKLASIFERCDSTVETNVTSHECVELLRECIEIHENLRKLLEYHINPVLDEETRERQELQIPSEKPIDPAAQVLSITAWGIQLGASESAHRLVSHINEPVVADELIPDRILDDVHGLVVDRRMLAKQIFEQVACCLEAPLGGLGAARMVLSLRQAMQQFQPNEPEYEQCQLMMDKLCGKSSKFSFTIVADQSTIIRTKAKLLQDNANHIARQWAEFTSGNLDG